MGHTNPSRNFEQRLGVLEEKDRYNDRRFRDIEEKVKEDKRDTDGTVKKLYTSLEEIKQSQHTQEKTNLKMDYTLNSINREREIERENKKQSQKDFKQLRFMMLGTVATLFGSLLLALIRSWLGI
ncbi:DUF2951 family protein [Staphylococcus sp. 18_1_E_LY]|uniref:DUF2951 family protein n=1 Tax=Staphylococcus lloydii TaxID=2781774 RepID=A0A7T1AZI7_9STAP|nr:DUF2951 family protein [Staphylococcus lloydii]MBF7027340.1 DUF2951 family protein [Staphylococcus lloydii]QPM75004.1 DUF2951 family protein [Staphylococcus lloydii]